MKYPEPRISHQLLGSTDVADTTAYPITLTTWSVNDCDVFDELFQEWEAFLLLETGFFLDLEDGGELELEV